MIKIVSLHRETFVFNYLTSYFKVYCIMKRFVLVHHYLESNHFSIVAFSDSMRELVELKLNHPRYGSSRHDFFVADNVPDSVSLSYVKNNCLLNICKNVAEYLGVAEYCMLKKSYFKSSAWFEKAKNSAFLGADIIDNY